MNSHSEQRERLKSLQGVMGRAAARAQGLKIFNGHQCPVRGHGRARRIFDGQCVCCLEAVDTIKKEAQEAGKAAALKQARAELAREMRREERSKLKASARAEAQALKVKQLEEQRKAAGAAKRATTKRERPGAAAAAVVPVPLAGTFRSPEEEPQDDSPPWD